MQPVYILIAIALYFLMLLTVGYITGKRAGKEAYFLGNKQSIWWLVAFGMLSDSMSGVTFISVPGDVLYSKFYYMQVVIGYLAGYLVIAFVLLPLYYRMGLTSIYTYLGKRFGPEHEITGSVFFILSRLIGSAGRLFLTAFILQKYLFNEWGFPFWGTVSVIIFLILVYTVKGGIRTLVFTDALQSFFLVGGLILCISILLYHLPHGWFETVTHSDLFVWFEGDAKSKWFFPKAFLGGAFICIGMTGLDQNMMQKNLTCKSLRDAQKNIISYGTVVFFVNILFLSLGVLLYAYAKEINLQLPLSDKGKVLTDNVFPLIALQKIGLVAGICFMTGLAAATFSSADSVLTTLTTSAYVNIFRLETNTSKTEMQKRNYRITLHIFFAVVLLLCILMFEQFNSKSLIGTILDIASLTYGPLLGLFAMGILTKSTPRGAGVVVACLLAPALSYLLSYNSKAWFNGYAIGLELLLINGIITFVLLYVVSLFTKPATLSD